MTKNEEKEIYVILGMHRSGTSTITRALQVFNIALGDALVGSRAGENDKGFFEDSDIYQFDQKLENALDSDWHYLGPVTEKGIAELCDRGYFEEAVRLIEAKTNNYNVYGFKDPRVARFLPFWSRVFDHCNIKTNYILIIRNPVSVARSLENRDGLAAEKSYLLWLSHIIPCLKETENSNRIIVDYDLLLKQPQQQLSRISTAFALDINQSEMGTFLDEFLDTGLRHDYSSVDDLVNNDACYPLVADVYKTLLECVKADRSQPCVEKKVMGEWLNEFDRIKPFFKLLDKVDVSITSKNEKIASLERYKRQNEHLEMQVDQYEHVLKEREKHLAHMIEAFEEKVKHVSSMEYTIKKQNEQLVAVQEQARNDQKQTIAELRGQVERADSEIKKYKEKIEVLILQGAEKQQEIEIKNKHITDITNSEIKKYKEEIEVLILQGAQKQQEIEIKNKHITDITNSLSWKITRPVRGVKSMLRKLLG